MRTISASGLQRIVTCPAAASLPAVIEEPGDAARLGSDLHLYLQRVTDNGRKAALSATPEEVRGICEAIEVDWIERVGGDAERAYCYNAITREALALGRLDRGYPTPQRGQLFCTVDLVYTNNDGSLTVVDFKTGRHRVAPCKANWQMKLAALAVAKVSGSEPIDMRIAYLLEDGTWAFDDASADELDLDAWALDLRAAYLRAEETAIAVAAGCTPDVSPSDDACRWCPCRQACPAHTALVRHAVSALAVDEAGEAITPARMGVVWERVQKLKKLIATVEEQIESAASAGPIPLPSGKVLRLVETSRESIDGEVAQHVLTEQFGADVAAAVCRPSATKQAFRALGKDSARALEAVRAAGGINTKVFMSAKEVKE